MFNVTPTRRGNEMPSLEPFCDELDHEAPDHPGSTMLRTPTTIMYNIDPNKTNKNMVPPRTLGFAAKSKSCSRVFGSMNRRNTGLVFITAVSNDKLKRPSKSPASKASTLTSQMDNKVLLIEGASIMATFHAVVNRAYEAPSLPGGQRLTIMIDPG